ncbi:23S rRNA (uracil(1939)-C(5))-methyltransferase RlmD [Bacillus kwashiorkori]|uniref:23S rRNA (uracil(1939)-C(5))-methyltransferase RlmD n=1 Tax=Bacillus kwashiorkori TaxID=1522318 RepID=UPI0007862061|nr:23S rRNA (uracil(1939)-C(5))-methyltransferase RlmD [Bacillus kwashiorkori]
MKQQPPVKKNEYIDVAFDDLTHEGFGVGKVEGYPIFVQGALPEEQALIKVIKVNKSFGYGKLVELKSESRYRVNIPESELVKYGGCQLQHMSYEGQLNFKQNYVEQVLKRVGKLSEVEVLPIIGMEHPTEYRNKAQVPVGEKDGKLVAGFFKPRTHEIIDTDYSIIQLQEVNEAVKVVKEVCRELNIPPYNEESHTGVLRHIMVRYGIQTGELMVVFITRTNDIPHKKTLIHLLTKRLPKLTSLIQNVNTNKTNVILGEKVIALWGNEVIYDYIGEVKFAISAKSFYQVNPVQTKILYDKALQFAELTGEETVIDAYCGIGTISLFLAKRAKKVYGVEIVADAINDARRNAKLNGISNVQFAVGEAEKVIPMWAEKGIQADVLVVDPPRKGCDEKLLETITTMEPKRIVYVSCNPATLARDLQTLVGAGYKATKVQPVDMFPFTNHVECVSQLILKEGN